MEKNIKTEAEGWERDQFRNFVNLSEADTDLEKSQSPTPEQCESVDADAEGKFSANANANDETKTVEDEEKCKYREQDLLMMSPTPCASKEVDLLPQNLILASDVKNHININGEGNVDVVLDGKVFLCRTVKDTRKGTGTGIQCVVTDPDGDDLIELHLYNYSFCEGVAGTVLNRVIPIGTIFAVKNPWFKSAQLVHGQVILTAGDPSRVEILSMKRLMVIFPDVKWGGKRQPQPQLDNVALDWSKSDLEVGAMLKQIGNSSFEDKRWSDALRWYDLGLDYLTDATDGTEHLNIINNKAAACLNFGCFNLALKYAQIVLDQVPDNLKAIFRKAKAFIGLAKYSEAVDFLNGRLSQNGNGNACGDGGDDLRKLNQLASDLLEQKSNGDISDAVLSTMVVAYRARDTASSDTSAIPELKGPIDLEIVEDKMRFIASEDIEPGRLLISCKPFAYTSKLVDTWAFPNEGGEIVKGHEAQVTQIANKISLDPELGKVVYKLGIVREREDDPNIHYTDFEDYDDVLGKVDVCKINDIVKKNSRGFVLHLKNGMRESSGTWLYGQRLFFAESCSEANVMPLCFNDVLTLRAVRKIKKGEVLTKRTIVPVDFLGNRAAALRKHGESCNCPLCSLEASESSEIVEERNEILSWLKNANLNYERVMEAALKKVYRLIELRKDVPHFNPCLVSKESRVLDVNWALFQFGRFEECEELTGKIISGVEYIASLYEIVLRISTLQIDCCIALRKEEKIRELIKSMKSMAKTHYGTSRENVMRSLFDESTIEDLKEEMNIDFSSLLVD